METKSTSLIFQSKTGKKFKFKLNSAWDYEGAIRLLQAFRKAGNLPDQAFIVTFYDKGEIYFSAMNIHFFKHTGCLIPRLCMVHITKEKYHAMMKMASPIGLS